MRPGIKKLILRVAVGLAVVAGAFAIFIGYALWSFHHEHPYGWSHCCDLGLSLALRGYAETHDGNFPAGEATPEASLSLLYRSQLADADLLRGKTVPKAVVEEILDRGELLTPDTCGWHYVEGLRLDDDGRLALFWDKEGLDHNGGRMAEGGHLVLFVNGQREYIRGSEWDAFLAQQRKLLAARKTAVGRKATAGNDGDKVKK